MADERKIPDSAIDAGGRTDNVSADAINHNGINATENNDAPTESREEQAKRLKEKKQASFEYADNYRQKLKKEAEERRMTPAQMRKKAEKEAAIAREKAEREAAIRQAIEREKEEAKERAERAEALRDQVEKSLAEKKAQEEAEKEALERAYEEQTEQTAPAPEEISEPEKAEALDEEPADETYDSAEDDDIEDVEEYADDSDEEEDEYDDYEEDDGLDGFTFDFDENDEDMTFTFGYGDDDGDEEEPDNDMILTFDTDDIIYNYEKQPKKKAAQRPAEPEEGEKAVAEPHPTVEEPVQATNKDTAQKPAVPAKKKKKAVSAPAPKKAVAMPKPAAKKRASRPAEVKAVPTVIPAAEPAPASVIDDRIAELLEENKQLLRENIDELRRKQAELEQRQAALESATPAQIDADNTATPAEVSTPESSDVTVIDEDDAKPATYVPEPEVVKPSSVIKESGPVRAAGRSEIKKIEEIPESELILNYAAGDAAENINSAAAVYGLTSLPPVSLKKKIRDNDRLSRKLERKLRKEKKDYRRAKTKEEKLEHIADCAEYQRAILDFDAESLAAAALLGNDYTTRKKHLRRDVGEYNAFAQKLEDMSTTQIPQAPATMPDDVILGNPYKRLPAVTTANLADNDANDPGAARNKDASPMSYVSQLDNDDDSITGISGRPAGAKGAKKKHALVKGEVKKGAKELRQKMRSNGKLLKENRKDLRNELEAANKSGFAEKTEHMVSGLNYQREIIAVLGDSYEAAVRTHDKAEAKRISRQIDKEVSAYNKLGRAVEKRTGEPIPAAFNTFAKDIADNREMKLPPVVKYGQATTEGSFTDSEDVLVIKRVEFAEEEGSAKVLQVGSRKGRKEEELPTVTVINEPVSGISVTPPSEPVTVTPLTPPAQTITLSSDKKSYELKDVVTSPTTPSTQTAVYIEPIIIGHPIESPKVDVPLRPMSERIVETADSAKRIGSKYADGSLGTITVSQADSTSTSRISEKKPAKMRESDKAEKAKKKVVYTLVEDTDHVKVFKADPTLRVAPRYDKVPFEDREVQVVKLKHVAEEPDSAKVIKANVPGVVPEEESFDFIPLVEGAEVVTNEQAQAEETKVEAKEVMAERDFEPVVFRSTGESASDEIGKKKLRKEASEKQEEQENEISDASEAQTETLTEEITEKPVADGAVLGELTEEPVSEEATEETKAEEEVIEETVEEPKAEEPAHEEAVEESETEEPVAEEATEELATEEATEEPSAEEAVVEETAEESKAEETVVEEVAEKSEQELPALVNYNKEENLAAEQEKEQETEQPVVNSRESEDVIPETEGVTQSEPEEHTVTVVDVEEAHAVSSEKETAEKATPDGAKTVSKIPDSAKVLLGKVKRTVEEDHEAIKIIQGAPARVVSIDTEAIKIISAAEGAQSKSGAYVIKQQQRTPDGKLVSEDVNDVLSVEGESVEVGDEAKSYEYKLDDVDIDVPEDFELSESAPDNAHGEETVTEIVDEAKSATQSDGDTAEEIKVDDGVLTIAYKPTYVITESTRTEADGNEKADIPLESFVTSRYTIQEHLPEAKPVEDLAEENTVEAEAEVIAEKPEGSYVIKQYAPMRSAKEQADAEAEAKAEQENARRPEEIIIYGKSAKQTPAEQTETVESRELSAPKAKGAYTLLESSKVKSAVEDTAAIDNDIVHVGEETVELIEETFPENYVTLTSDTVADEIKPEKTVEKASDTIVVNEDVTSIPQVVENADAAKVIPAASDTDKTADGYSGYVITEDSAQAKRFEATARGYTLTEEPDSAKRFEASEPVEIENGKYVITVLPESAKTVEGRPELKYTVAVDEDGKKTVKADIADESKAGEYRIVEDKDGIRVLSGVEKTEKHIVENAREISEIKDTSTFVKAEDAPVYEAEHTAEVLEEPVSENYVTLTSDTVLEETKPEKTAEKLADTIVVNEKPASKGYSIEIDEDAKRTISARENAADSKDVHYGVAEQDSSAKVIPSFTIINAPKSRDAYVITEDKSGLKTIVSTSEAAHGKPEIRETEGKVIGATAEAVHGKPEIHETDGKIIGAAETQKSRVVCESPEDAKVITLAKETGYEIDVRPEDAHVIGEKQAQRVVSEVENPKELLKNNKVLNTKKSQNNYAILESRDTKVVYAAEQETAEEQNAQPIGGVYTLGIEEGKTISAAESTEVAPQQTYRISTDEEHRKILEAIEILKRANYDVSEIERAENMIQAAKVLNTKSEDNSYAIVESRDVKVVSAAESAIEEVDENPTVSERAGSERVISAAAETEQSGGYEIRETAQEPKATEARVINASKSRDSYVILEKRGTEKVIEEAPISEDTAERAPEYFVSEKLGTEKTVHGTETAPESVYAVREAYSTGIIIPEGTKILNAEKGGDRYIIAEHRGAAPTDTVQGESNIPVSHSFDISEKSGTERIIHKAAPDEEQITASDGYRISESGNPYVVTQRKLNRHGKPMVYEVGGAHVVGARKQPHERKDPTVFEQSGTEKIISKKDFKLPAKPLVYEEIGTQKIVRPEASIRNTVKDCIVEYKGTEMVVKGNIPIVDVLIDPYKNVNMGVLAINDLKKYLSDNDKEIAKLKYHFRYAKKQKAESEKSADKIMSHIAMINYQCLICERYVERISVCNNAESRYYAEKGAAMLKDELKKYNDLITEYNVTTSSKIPLADKTLPKRVLAGEAYEHLTRISYKLINEQAPMKTSKKFNKKKKGSDKPAAKIIEQKRYLADIKLIERCDDESANDVLMVQNRYDFESALLKGERDMMNFKFAKRSKKNAARKLYINRKLKALKKAKAKAVRYEALDNERYYRVLSCDTSLESYKNDNNKKKKVTKIVTEVGKLLKERDDINSKLNMMYAGTLADISGAGDGEKWRSVKAASAKKHSRKLRGKANALKNSVPGFGEKKAERVHMFNSLLDAKVEAQSTIDLCKYRLKREKNKFADKMSIRKDIREARKRIRLIDREIKERRKLILEEHYGPDASFELTALVGMCVLGAIGVVWLAKTAGIDIIGTVKPYVQQWIDSIGAASPAIKSVVDMIKGYLM